MGTSEQPRAVLARPSSRNDLSTLRFRCDGSPAQSNKLTAAQAEAVLAELRRPPEAVPVIESISFGERLFGLGSLWDIAANGSRWFETHLGSDIPLNLPALFGFDASQEKLFRRLANDPLVDWNEAFRCQNKCYDRIVAAYATTPTVAKRRELLAALDEEWKGLTKRAAAEAAASDSADPKVASRAHARQLTHLIMGGMTMAAGVLNVESNRQTKRNLATLALALASYHANHGKYPKALAELIPKYLAMIPKDAFSDGDLHYRLDGDGYLLYSVGPNGKDEGGRNCLADRKRDSSDDDSTTDEQKAADDIAIHTPPHNDAKK